MIKKLLDNEFTVSSAWVKEHDEGVYETLLEMLEEFAADEGNLADWDDVEDFKAGNWLVDYFFSDAFCEEGEINVQITAGRDGQYLANQPPWIDEIVTPEDWDLENYLEFIEEGEE